MALIPVDHDPDFIDDQPPSSQGSAPGPSPPVAAAVGADQPVTEWGRTPEWLGKFGSGGIAGVLGMPSAMEQAQTAEAQQADLIHQHRYGAATLTGLDNPMLYALGAGPVGEGGAIANAAKQNELSAALLEQHQARGDAGLPLIGKGKVTPPANVQTMDDFDNLVGNYMAYAREGQPAAQYWYERSGASTLAHAGDPETATRFAGGLAITSPQTPVPQNIQYAVRAHNEAMLGMPIDPGMFPKQSEALEGLYYGGAPVSGEKIGPFRTGIAEEWDPNLGGHSFVNDIWNMRALGYTDPKTGGLYSSSPLTGEHNFARIVANVAQDRLGQEGLDLTPKQLQASVWASVKARTEGTPVDQAARDFSDFLGNSYGQLSWESAPGATTNHLPEFATASPEQQQEFHNAIRGALTDDQGRDIIARHLGLMTGTTLDAPGVYGNVVSPGSQSMVALGPAVGGIKATGGGAVDPASRTLAETAERVRGLLLRQDGVAWHRPFYAGMSPDVQNLAHFDLGRPPTPGEAQAATEAMNGAASSRGANPGSYSAISTPTGFRFVNDSEWNGLSHPAFQDAAKALNDPRLPDLKHVSGHADVFHERNDWQENPNGQGYLDGIGRTGSPDLQRRAAELLAGLGPRISQIEENFAQRHGWTPDRDTRVWETNPVIQGHTGAVVPNPPRPWIQRPAPPGSGPSLFSGVALPPGMSSGLIPVDHQPEWADGRS